MYVYFEDDELHSRPIMTHIVHAEYGVSQCQEWLEHIKKTDPNGYVYTNYLGAMSFDYSWDVDKNECTCYVRDENGDWVNIQELTDKELRPAHNIPKMYLAGEFQKNRS